MPQRTSISSEQETKKWKRLFFICVIILCLLSSLSVRGGYQGISGSLLESSTTTDSKDKKLPQQFCPNNPYLPSMDVDHVNIEAYRRKLASARERAVSNPANKHDHKRFKIFEKLAQCKSTACIGGACRQDTRKIVCGLENLQKTQQADSGGKSTCVVYSIGGNNQWEFEVDLIKRSKCEIHTFDCTGAPSRFIKPTNDTRLQFHYECLQGDNNKGKTRSKRPMGDFFTLQELTEKHNHKQIDLFKMDIEGFEWGVFKQFASMKENMRSMLPMQMLVELHYQTQFKELHPTLEDFKHEVDMVDLATDLLNMGYIVVKRDNNKVCQHCTELTLVRVYC